MALDGGQQQIAQRIVRVGRQMGASPKVLKAAIEAGLVESNLRNLNHGDRDSLGVFQQRPSQGWRRPRDVEGAAEDFFKAAIPLRGKHGRAGDLAQAVQRSAFPARYHERGAEADEILGRVGGGDVAREFASSFGVDLPGTSNVSDLLRAAVEPRQAPAASAPPLPAHSARAASPAGYQAPPPSSGPAPRTSLDDLLAAVRTQTSPSAAAALEPESTAGPRASGGGKKGLVGAVRATDRVAANLEIPVTARQEPGHTEGGDHDPKVKGASARDYGGSEEQRERMFREVTSRLGVKGAKYKGRDINVVVDGVRWQIISRDHGSGPHLHIGWRLAK